MVHDLPSAGDTQVLTVEQPHGFVDSCIALIETLLESREISLVTANPVVPPGE